MHRGGGGNNLLKIMMFKTGQKHQRQHYSAIATKKLPDQCKQYERYIPFIACWECGWLSMRRHTQRAQICISITRCWCGVIAPPSPASSQPPPQKEPIQAHCSVLSRSYPDAHILLLNFTKFLKRRPKARRMASPQPSALWVDQSVSVLCQHGADSCFLQAFCFSLEGLPSKCGESSPHRVVQLLSEAILQNSICAWREFISRRGTIFLHWQIVVGERGMALN